MQHASASTAVYRKLPSQKGEIYLRSVPGRFFEKLQKIDRTYRKFCQQKLSDWNFTPNEIAVILFLHNNAPDLDTASDIVRCKGISKGLIAKSVDSLCRRGYLETIRDTEDRRIIHLRLTKEADPIRRHMEENQHALNQRLLKAIDPEALSITSKTLDMLLENTEFLLKEAMQYGNNQTEKRR